MDTYIVPPPVGDCVLPDSAGHLSSMHVFPCVQISPFIKTQSYWIRAHPNDLILTWSSTKILFPKKGHINRYWGWGLLHFWGGHNSTITRHIWNQQGRPSGRAGWRQGLRCCIQAEFLLLQRILSSALKTFQLIQSSSPRLSRIIFLI